MLDIKLMFAFMTFLCAVLILGFLYHSSIPSANAQSLGNESSGSSSTVCMNDQPCQTTVCSENKPCTTSKTPNIPNPYEDYLDAREDYLDARENMLEDFE
jgi:hypothetical protein